MAINKHLPLAQRGCNFFLQRRFAPQFAVSEKRGFGDRGARIATYVSFHRWKKNRGLLKREEKREKTVFGFFSCTRVLDCVSVGAYVRVGVCVCV